MLHGFDALRSLNAKLAQLYCTYCTSPQRNIRATNECKAGFLVCKPVEKIRGCTDVLKGLHFGKSTPRACGRGVGGYLNVFIVFYWNKSFKTVPLLCCKVHSQF